MIPNLLPKLPSETIDVFEKDLFEAARKRSLQDGRAGEKRVERLFAFWAPGQKEILAVGVVVGDGILRA